METSGNRTALGVSSDIAQLIGNRLRRAREAIGRSTSVLSAKIKVREHYLVAIEEGLWNELPPGLNGRGLVRIYARELAVSVPELDQAANQSVMPAEQDAQAPYQLGQKRDVSSDRELGLVKGSSESQTQNQRNTEVSFKTTNTLNSIQRAQRTLEPQQIQPDVRRQMPSSGFHKVIESTPEEEPLDVVTPDVASILGITLDVLEETPKPKSAREQVTVPPIQIEAPPASAPQVEIVQSEVKASEINRSAETNHKKSKKHNKNKHEHRAETPSTHQEEAPLVMTGSPLTFENSTQKTVETLHAQPKVVETNAPEVNPQQFAPVEKDAAPTQEQITPHETVTTATSETLPQDLSAKESEVLDSAPETVSSGVSAAETYLKSHLATEETTENRATERKSFSGAMRWAVGLMAACVGALIIGQIFVRTNNPEAVSESPMAVEEPKVQADTPVEQNGSQSAADTPTQAVPANPAASVETNSPTNSEVVSKPVGGAGEMNQPSPQAAEFAPNVAVSLDKKISAPPAEASAVAQKQAETEVMAAQESAAEATEESSNTPSRITETTGTSVATLTLSEPLEIQITADGKRIFSGKHNPGKLEVKFNNRAEIFVQDGSKAKLKYAGWDHGALGQSGRKRRIVLNAQTFSGSGN